MYQNIPVLYNYYTENIKTTIKKNCVTFLCLPTQAKRCLKSKLPQDWHCYRSCCSVH